MFFSNGHTSGIGTGAYQDYLPLSAGIRLADVYPLADQLQQRKFQPRR